MSKCYKLIEIQRAFDSLRASIRNGGLGIGADVRMFNDLNLSLRQAMVLAWLMDHNDSIYSIGQMCQELHIEEDAMQTIIDTLLGRQFLEIKDKDIDVSDAFFFILIDFQTMRECGMISSWSEYYERQTGLGQGDEEHEIF